MALTPYDPFKQMKTIQKEFDRFFNNFFSNKQSLFTDSMNVTIEETETAVEVTCSIPGINHQDQIDMNIYHDILVIQGTINAMNEVKGENTFQQAYYESRFRRDILLPSPVAKEGVRASYKNDILKIRMPKLKNSVTKKIEIDFQ